jgi:hypothetical protein
MHGDRCESQLKSSVWSSTLRGPVWPRLGVTFGLVRYQARSAEYTACNTWIRIGTSFAHEIGEGLGMFFEVRRDCLDLNSQYRKWKMVIREYCRTYILSSSLLSMAQQSVTMLGASWIAEEFCKVS